MTRPPGVPQEAVLMEVPLRLTQGFAAWPRAAMDRLLATSYLGRYARGELVATEVDSAQAFAIISGHVVVTRVRRRGVRSQETVLGPGMVLGLTRVFDARPAVAMSCHAHDDVVVVHMPTLLILEILNDDPRLWIDVAQMLLNGHAQIRDSLLSHAIGASPRRLAATIDGLTVLYGVDVKGTLRLKIRQEDLAAILQVTRQSVNKEIKTLAEAGVIKVGYGTITILDIQALRRMASAS